MQRTIERMADAGSVASSTYRGQWEELHQDEKIAQSGQGQKKDADEEVTALCGDLGGGLRYGRRQRSQTDSLSRLFWWSTVPFAFPLAWQRTLAPLNSEGWFSGWCSNRARLGLWTARGGLQWSRLVDGGTHRSLFIR